MLIADKFAADANTRVVTVEQGIDDDWEGVDIGPRTMKRNEEVLQRSKTIFWNGP